MNHTISTTGALVFTLDAEERAELMNDIQRDDHYVDIIDLFAETGLQGNSDLEVIRPEDVGALTDSPIFATDAVRDDCGEIKRVGDVWWFPDYQVRNPAEILIETGRVAFAPAPENAARRAA